MTDHPGGLRPPPLLSQEGKFPSLKRRGGAKRRGGQSASTSIRNSVYRIVRRIPRGRVLSYGDIGRMIGAGPRQVAAAIRACPPGLPWHRVVGAGGKILTPGETAWIQRERLIAEGIRFRGVSFSYEVYRWRPKANAD